MKSALNSLLAAISGSVAQLRLQHIAMSIDVLERQIENDRRAARMVRVLPNGPEIAAKLGKQVSANLREIAELQIQQLHISADLPRGAIQQ